MVVARSAIVRQRIQQPNTHVSPAPVRGWNARDSIDKLEEDEAEILDNWYPEVGRIEVRGGFASHATGMTGTVETIAPFVAGSVSKLVTAGNNNIWDATSVGAASSLGSGFSNDRWQWRVMDAKLGLVNGVDTPQTYDGTTLGNMTISGTGLTVTQLKGINVHQNRSWFWTTVDGSAWYSATNALGGALTEFDLSTVAGFGGNLTAMETWTRDGGDGPDDFAVFFMSSGETLVYAGTDPAASATWALVGRYILGAPVNIRGYQKIGGDLACMTQDGYISLQSAINTTRARPREGKSGGVLSDKIHRAVHTVIQSNGSDFGWEVEFYPRRNYLLFNHPDGSNLNQHILNLTTGAWCRFTEQVGSAWGVYNDELYFGGAGGIVYKADSGTSNDGANITALCKPAFNYLGRRDRRKRLTALRIVAGGDGTVPLSVDINADFQDQVFAFMPIDFAGSVSGGASWDTATWDVDDWAGADIIRLRTILAGRVGYNFSPTVRYQNQGQNVRLESFTYFYKSLSPL
ncbi:MAG: hypothetical protein ACR2QC_04265 [Gammaproteobacteria bacterium]